MSNKAVTAIQSTFKRLRGDTLVRVEADATRQELAEIRSEIRRLSRQVESVQRATKPIITRPKPLKEPPKDLDPVVTAEFTSWGEKAQGGELAFHKKPNIRSSEGWSDGNAALWESFGFSPDGWEGKRVLDVGAGSRLRSLFFEGADVVVIEPLADEFAAEVEWNDLHLASQTHSVPAEELIPSLVDTADLVVSINALDHGYEFEEAIRNIRSYVKDDGLVFLSYDLHESVDDLHPLIITDEISRKIFSRVGLTVENHHVTKSYHKGLTGGAALNYWLRKA